MILLERDLHLKALRSALNEAGDEGRVALVYGEAGIGKTSLVEHFVKEQEKSWRILRGACDSLFTPRPLGPLYDIAPQISSPKGAQGNLPALLDSESNRQAIFSACLNELKERSTILVIEDVHWADEATLDLLKYLSRRIRQTTSLMILTYRDDEIGVDHPLRLLLGDLASSHALHRIPVSSLTNEAVRELAKNKDVDPLALHRLTNGNPFFVTEVLAVESRIPETVRDAVLARAARLSLSARAVLEAAAVIGSRVETWLLSNIVGAESANVEECIAHGMLQAQGDYYAFRHELARHTILESISPQRKIALHHLTLNTLKESPVTRENLARLAHHAEAINDRQAILEFAPLAGWWASELGAHREAVAHYKTALQYANVLSAEKRAELLDSYADECDLTENTAEAKRAQEEALNLWRELGQGEKEGRALRRLSEFAFTLIQKLEAEHYLVKAIAMLKELLPSKELAMTYSLKSRLHLYADQFDETIHWGSRAIELAERLGDLETLAHALTNIGMVEMKHGKHAEGQPKLERGLQLSLDHGFHYHAARAFIDLAIGLSYLRDYTSALHRFEEALAYCSQHDLDYWHTVALGNRALYRIEHGQWNEAEQDILAAEHGMSAPIEDVTRARLWLQVRRGNPISPEALHTASTLKLNSPLFETVSLIAALLAEAAWLRGDLAQCRVEAETIFQIACQRNAPKPIGHLGYWMWRAGAINTPPPNAAEPYAIQIAGNWKEAAEIWEKYGCPYEQAMALMDGDEAAQLAALEIFERIGARPALELLKQKMRAAGISVPRGPRPATREHPFGLTAREMEVLACLAEGLSNSAIGKKLSLSTRTVEHHIASILQKMGVQTRAEAAVLSSKQHLLATK